jgi:Phage P22-like portal protein
MAQTNGYYQDSQDRFNLQTPDEKQEDKVPTPKTQTAGALSEKKKRDSKGDEEILVQCRKDYSYMLDYWSYNRDLAADDMRFVLGKFYTQAEKQKRAGRPCLEPDEISQYLKQCTNNYRQAKRSIKVIPRGEGASDQDAERRSAIIRGIIYQSNGQAAFTTGHEGAVHCGFGGWMVTTKSMGKNGGVEPRIRRIPNQFTMLFDPDAREADFSDQNKFFVTDSIRESDFEERFPDAQKTSFSTEDRKMAPDWFKGGNLVIAEYWRRYKGQVTQYLTNGVEILSEIPWLGSWIPAVIVVGEELYEQDDDGQSKRVFMSMTRRMKTPQKMLAFIASQEAEEFGMAPRSPLLLWEGQEAADKKALENLNTTPRAFVKLKPGKDAAGSPLPDLPAGGRLPFTPNAQAYEIAREAWRRSIQSAAGITPLPTDAQRQNEKSGIALEKIQNQEQVGTFHFTDNMDRALEFTGRILNELISNVMDTPRSVSVRGNDDSHSLLVVGAQEHENLLKERAQALMGDKPMPQAGLDYLITDRGEWDVTLSTGPDFQSQREEQSDFVDTLIKEGPALQLPPQVLNKLVSLAVKMKDLGHFGDEIAKLLDPDDQSQQQLQMAQQQLAEIQKQAADLAQEVQQLKLEKHGRVIDNEYKTHIKGLELAMQGQVAQLNADIKVLIAEIQTKAQNQAERDRLFQETQTENHHAAHEVALQKDQQAHEHSIANKQAIVQAQQAAQAQQSQQQSDGAGGQ